VAIQAAACSCGSGDEPPGTTAGVGGDGGTAVDSGGNVGADAADALEDEASNDWDPVWHETEPKDWPKAPKANPDGCGQGCRVALDILEQHPPHVHFVDSFSALAAVNTQDGLLFYSDFDRDETWLLGARLADFDGYTSPFLFAGFLSMLYVEPDGKGRDVKLMNVRTGETKTVYHAGKDAHILFTALNAKYLFWNVSGRGIMSRNLETGVTRTLVHFDCEDLCAVPTGLVCFNSPNLFIDQETGQMTEIAPGPALQVDGTCSHERDEIIWIDYRDPPGPGSDFMGKRSGGEVYMKHLVSGELARLTHDSPDAPTAKAYPAVGKELAVWKHASKQYDQNPEWSQDVYAVTQDLMVLDRVTGQRCRIHSDLVKYFTHMVVRGRWVYGNMGYVVGIDVDDPAIGCVPE
jgi:hypothetical protein